VTWSSRQRIGGDADENHDVTIIVQRAADRGRVHRAPHRHRRSSAVRDAGVLDKHGSRCTRATWPPRHADADPPSEQRELTFKPAWARDPRWSTQEAAAADTPTATRSTRRARRPGIAGLPSFMARRVMELALERVLPQWHMQTVSCSPRCPRASSAMRTRAFVDFLCPRSAPASAIRGWRRGLRELLRLDAIQQHRVAVLKNR